MRSSKDTDVEPRRSCFMKLGLLRCVYNGPTTHGCRTTTRLFPTARLTAMPDELTDHSARFFRVPGTDRFAECVNWF
jgi:hypothetical protein